VKVNWILYGGKERERERETWRVLICGRFVWFCFCCTGGAGIGLASEDSEV